MACQSASKTDPVLGVYICTPICSQYNRAASRLVSSASKHYYIRMNTTIKLTKVGSSTGAVFPKELLALLRVGPGDTLYVSETPDGGVRLTACDPAFAAKMAAAEEIMRDDRDILRILAQ